jgi:hypothetical protein
MTGCGKPGWLQGLVSGGGWAGFLMGQGFLTRPHREVLQPARGKSPPPTPCNSAPRGKPFYHMVRPCVHDSTVACPVMHSSHRHDYEYISIFNSILRCRGRPVSGPNVPHLKISLLQRSYKKSETPCRCLY